MDRAVAGALWDPRWRVRMTLPVWWHTVPTERDVSQCRLGAAEGKRCVRAVQSWRRQEETRGHLAVMPTGQ